MINSRGNMPKSILYLGLDPTHYINQNGNQGEIFHWPIIQIVPRPLSDPSLRQALENFDCYSHVIATSKSTVAILHDYLPQLNIKMEVWRKKMTLAVGKVTAKHLQAIGITPAKVAQEETAEGIIAELEQWPLENAHLFWPHSAQARPIIKDFLETKNISHTTCILYESQPHISGPLPQLEQFNAIVFTSPSTVEAFLHIFGSFPLHAQLIPIGPITAHCLQSKLFSRQ